MKRLIRIITGIMLLRLTHSLTISANVDETIEDEMIKFIKGE